MKVIVFKSYDKKSESSYDYGDSYEEVWHKFNAFEKSFEISSEEYSKLCSAIAHFNAKRKSEYELKSVVVLEDDEVNDLLANFIEYEAKEAKAAKKAEEARLLRLEEANKKREAAKAERSLKKLAKELGISVEEVRAKLA